MSDKLKPNNSNQSLTLQLKSLIPIIFIVILSVLLWQDASREQVIQLTGLDGLGHLLGFLLLSWLIHTGLKLSLLVSALTLSLYAGLTELGQFYLGFRNGEFRDFIADVLGVLLYVLLRLLYQTLTKKNTKKRLMPHDHSYSDK